MKVPDKYIENGQRDRSPPLLVLLVALVGPD